MKLMPPVCRPLERVSADIAGPMPESGDEKYKYVLILTDAFSRFVDGFCLKDQKARSVASCLVEYITRYGHIEALHTDLGTHFTAEVIKELSDLFGVKRLLTTPYAPQSDMCERYIQTIKNALAMFCTKHSDWSKYLRGVVYAHNVTSSTETTLHSPFYLFMGRAPRVPDGLDFTVQKDEVIDDLDYPQVVLERMAEAMKLVEESQQTVNKRNQSTYNMKAKPVPFSPSDIVYLHVGKRAMVAKPGGGGISRKLRKEVWQGPFVVTSVKGVNALLRHAHTGDSCGPVHLNRLKRGFTRFGIFSDSMEALDDKTKSTSGENSEASGSCVGDKNTRETRGQSQHSLGKSDVGQNEPAHASKQEQSVSGRVLPGGMYEVKKILDSFYDRKKKTRFYRIHWKGFGIKDSTYEPAENVPLELRQLYHNSK